MIPTTIAIGEDISVDFEGEKLQPTKTYRMALGDIRVQNYTDGQAAMKQAIFKALQTERYDHPKIYSNNYGVEFKDLIGKSIYYVIPEIERRITEALTWDERITEVKDFNFESKKGNILVNFTACTIFGEISSSVGVPV